MSAPSSVLGEVRDACARVMAEARYIRIDDARLARVARELAEAADEPLVFDPAHHHVGPRASTLAYVFCLDAVNFGSGYFPFMAKREGCSGYFTVATALKERFEGEGPLDRAALEAMDARTCARIFAQDLAVPEMAELMDLFARAWRDLGRWLGAHFAGDFEGAIEAAGGQAVELVGWLARMPFYDDVEHYGDLRVPFYKRAQLTCADLSLAFEGKGPGAFDDLDQLTVFADNLVPHVLRRLGVLEYDADLLARIDREEPIPAGSPEEVEIRAAAVHSVERMCALLRADGRHVTAQSLDHRLWSRGQSPGIKDRPRHRTRSVYY